MQGIKVRGAMGHPRVRLEEIAQARKRGAVVPRRKHRIIRLKVQKMELKEKKKLLKEPGVWVGNCGWHMGPQFTKRGETWNQVHRHPATNGMIVDKRVGRYQQIHKSKGGGQIKGREGGGNEGTVLYTRRHLLHIDLGGGGERCLDQARGARTNSIQEEGNAPKGAVYEIFVKK